MVSFVVFFPLAVLDLELEIDCFGVPFWQQTNTADMLDLAVDYIKDLQKQFKVTEREPQFPLQHFFLVLFALFFHLTLAITLSVFQTLSDRRANCKCLNIQNPIPNQVL